MPYHDYEELDIYLYYDPITCRYFNTSYQEVKKAQEKVRELLDEYKGKTEDKQETPDMFDAMTESLKKLRNAKGYLLVDDVLDIFDREDPELLDNGKVVNPFELYCGNPDRYKEDIKHMKDRCYHIITESDNIDEIREYAEKVHLMDEALEALEKDND